MGSAPVHVQCPMSPHFLTTCTCTCICRCISRLLRLALASWAFARVGVHRLSLRLPYLSVLSIYRLHLPLNFSRVSFLRLMYLHPSVYPSLTHFFGEVPCLVQALVPDVVLSIGGAGVRMKQRKSLFKFLHWPGFEPRTLQCEGRERHHSTAAHTLYGDRDTLIVRANCIRNMLRSTGYITM